MIHQYKMGGVNIVLDVNSGAVHTVDDVAYDMIARFGSEDKDALIDEIYEAYKGAGGVTKEDVAECWGEIAALKEAGQLFQPAEGVL